MDPQRFDAISRRLGTSGSRRSAVRLLGGALALAGLIPPSLAEASPRHRRQAHSSGATASTDGPISHRRRHPQPCDPGLIRCKTRHHKHACVAFGTDANCSRCGDRCADGTTCQQGACAAACVPKTCAQLGAACGTLNDGCGHPLNCGGCPECQECNGGSCIPVATFTPCSIGMCCEGNCISDNVC